MFINPANWTWHDGTTGLRDVVREARSLGFVSVNVVTNGTLLDASSIARLADLDMLLVSWEGPPEVQRHVRKGSRGDELDRIRLAVAAGLKVAQINSTPKRIKMAAMI